MPRGTSPEGFPPGAGVPTSQARRCERGSFPSGRRADQTRRRERSKRDAIRRSGDGSRGMRGRFVSAIRTRAPPTGRSPSSGQRAAERARTCRRAGAIGDSDPRLPARQADAERTDALPLSPRPDRRPTRRPPGHGVSGGTEAEWQVGSVRHQGRVTCEWRRLLVDSEREAAAPTGTRRESLPGESGFEKLFRDAAGKRFHE